MKKQSLFLLSLSMLTFSICAMQSDSNPDEVHEAAFKKVSDFKESLESALENGTIFEAMEAMEQGEAEEAFETLKTFAGTMSPTTHPEEKESMDELVCSLEIFKNFMENIFEQPDVTNGEIDEIYQAIGFLGQYMASRVLQEGNSPSEQDLMNFNLTIYTHSWLAILEKYEYAQTLEPLFQIIEE